MRRWRPTSPATWALLDHLERVGFDGAPRFLGVDDPGREILSFIPGEAAIEPYPDWALTDEALVSVAGLLRRYHDAAASFDGGGRSWPDFVPAEFRDGLVSHNDPNLDNVIFAGGVAVGLIDFDLAGRDRSRVVEAAIHTHERCYRVIRAAVDGGHETFGRMWRDGGEARADRTRHWIAAHGRQMRAALRVQ